MVDVDDVILCRIIKIRETVHKESKSPEIACLRWHCTPVYALLTKSALLERSTVHKESRSPEMTCLRWHCTLIYALLIKSASFERSTCS